jgi:hypothetical protein
MALIGTTAAPAAGTHAIALEVALPAPEIAASMTVRPPASTMQQSLTGTIGASESGRKIVPSLAGTRLLFRLLGHPSILPFTRLEEHEQRLRKLLNQLQRYRILISLAKCVFRASGVTFLGYKVSTEDSRLLKDGVAHLQDCPVPRPPVSSAASWACSISTGDFCPTPLLPRHLSMAFFPAPESRALIPSTGRQTSTEPSMNARRICHAPHYWRTPTHPRHLHSLRTPPLPPWVPFCRNVLC